MTPERWQQVRELLHSAMQLDPAQREQYLAQHCISGHYEAHYHEERNHQGKGNLLLFPLRTPAVPGKQEQVRCRERLGGLLKYYERKTA